MKYYGVYDDELLILCL